MMQKKNLSNTMLSLLYFPLAGLLLYLSFHSPQIGVWLGSLGGISLILLLALVVLPIGRLRFGQASQSLFTWFCKVACLEIVLVLVFLGGVTAFFGGGPIFTQKAIEIEALMAAVQDYKWMIWSFIPWALLITWVVLIGYYYYVRKLGPYPHQVGSDVFANLMPDRAKSFAETSMHATNTMTIAILSSIVLLLVVYSIQIQFDLAPHGLLMPIGFTILGFFSLFAFLYFRKTKLRALDKKGLHLGFCINVSLAIILISLISTSYFTDIFIKSVVLEPSQLLCDSCLGYFQTTLPSNRMAAYFWGWGLVFLPLSASIFIRVSKGRSIREIILGLTILPLLLYLVVGFNFDAALNLFSSIGFFDKAATKTQKISLMLSLALVSYGLLMGIVYGQNTSHVLYAGVLKNLDTCKPGRMRVHQGTKLIGLSRMYMPIYLAMATFIIMHMVGGWFLIQINLEIFAIILMCQTYSAFIIIFIHFKQHRLWFNPELAKPFHSNP